MTPCALQVRERQRRLAGCRPARVDGGDRDVVEALRGAGADVEDARLLRVVEEIQIHAHRVFDGDEIAPLLAVAVAAAAFEQLDRCRSRDTG